MLNLSLLQLSTASSEGLYTYLGRYDELTIQESVPHLARVSRYPGEHRWASGS